MYQIPIGTHLVIWPGMKTTLDIDDALMRLARKAALDRGVTLTQVIEEAIAAAVLRPSGGPPFRLEWQPVKGVRPPAIDIADRVALYDKMEERG